MILAPFIVLFLIRHLRKTIKTFSPDPVWEKRLQTILYVVAGVLVADVVFRTTGYSIWFWHLILLGIILITFKLPVLAPARRTMLGVIPIVTLSFITDVLETLFPDFYNKIHNYFDIASAIAITWLVAMMIISNKQIKVLEKERLARLAEEERNRFIEVQKNELEKLVAERTMELTQQKEELENALVELQATQKQLIQSEKMASLGELTAGIAHEIQNPLNFVNNFSEVSVELISEMKDELRVGNNKAASDIADDIENNLHKISHHGRRADGIVKGMLQHSRSSTGVKEPTDINALADEYLRLSYHGLRAKDKNFNATMHSDLDDTIGLIDLIPQDIGRVLLNLFTNAFYSVSAKKRALEDSREKYEPTVLVTTKLNKRAGDNNEDIVSVCVRDNGMGIPQRVVDKIYQPFFTTKPSGEGTGLGLSLSYDIINKGHNGTMRVNTKEGEYAEFIIDLPVVNGT